VVGGLEMWTTNGDRHLVPYYFYSFSEPFTYQYTCTEKKPVSRYDRYNWGQVIERDATGRILKTGRNVQEPDIQGNEHIAVYEDVFTYGANGLIEEINTYREGEFHGRKYYVHFSESEISKVTFDSRNVPESAEEYSYTGGRLMKHSIFKYNDSNQKYLICEYVYTDTGEFRQEVFTDVLPGTTRIMYCLEDEYNDLPRLGIPGEPELNRPWQIIKWHVDSASAYFNMLTFDECGNILHQEGITAPYEKITSQYWYD
jgi:hypothetical protein